VLVPGSRVAAMTAHVRRQQSRTAAMTVRIVSLGAFRQVAMTTIVAMQRQRTASMAAYIKATTTRSAILTARVTTPGVRRLSAMTVNVSTGKQRVVPMFARISPAGGVRVAAMSGAITAPLLRTAPLRGAVAQTTARSTAMTAHVSVPIQPPSALEYSQVYLA